MRSSKYAGHRIYWTGTFNQRRGGVGMNGLLFVKKAGKRGVTADVARQAGYRSHDVDYDLAAGNIRVEPIAPRPRR